ncbi:hypothetical protein VNO78_32840 [Psophocarpus tetragonolobus]|uniref:Uncharacterized protein n=1 Tax=Psophocarpus tetragonolobus TaxID=3891 RepID=A0AAN9P026_PSOTE
MEWTMIDGLGLKNGFLDTFNYDKPCDKLWWKLNEWDFKGNLRPFEIDVDAMELANYAISNKCEIGIFVQHRVLTAGIIELAGDGAKNDGQDDRLGENMVDVETEGVGGKDRGGGLGDRIGEDQCVEEDEGVGMVDGVHCIEEGNG